MVPAGGELEADPASPGLWTSGPARNRGRGHVGPPDRGAESLSAFVFTSDTRLPRRHDHNGEGPRVIATSCRRGGRRDPVMATMMSSRAPSAPRGGQAPFAATGATCICKAARPSGWVRPRLLRMRATWPGIDLVAPSGNDPATPTRSWDKLNGSPQNSISPASSCGAGLRRSGTPEWAVTQHPLPREAARSALVHILVQGQTRPRRSTRRTNCPRARPARTRRDRHLGWRYAD